MVQRTFLWVLALVIIVLSACNSDKKQDPVKNLFGNQEPDSVYTPFYAKGFSISYFGDNKLIEVYDPWDSTRAGSLFVVGDETTPEKFRNSQIPFIEFPVTNWAAFSSTQVVFAEKIGMLETLKSVAEPQYISNSYIQERLKKDEVRNVGMANAADVEVLLEVSPQFIFVSPFKDNRYSHLADAGLLLINDASYLETSPLGRAEWLVFFSAFFDKEKEAVSIFKEISERYNSITGKVSETNIRPTVVTGTLFNAIWYMPAGESYMARLFNDAGTSYEYSDREGTGSLGLDFETVFNDFHDSDYWIFTVNHAGQFTRDDLLQMDERYGDFHAFKDGKIIFSNTHHSLFYEKGIIEPDVVLKDLAASLHPNLYPNYEAVYFEFLNE
ncbi:ABC transporter substrate-binding protein [Marinilabilia rubra]|uniref:Iron ABC transporter substrate-binding protein n=1 Tax=Marinilabilia rubra TaxID=2162893 RepID=A0A2U2B407_9BACT|nr:ABC transporter substrate-binding protein [Marinilabilia rubra]PWD97801.1 iron ABC transporter substrate-binding protein [Marinilabilia rubra]